MKATINYLDKEILRISKNLLNEKRLDKKYPIKFKKEGNTIKFIGFDKLK